MHAKTSYDYNATVAAEALERLLIALDKIVIIGKLGIKSSMACRCQISLEQLFGVGFSWTLISEASEADYGKGRESS